MALDGRVATVLTPHRAPHRNGYAERRVRSIKEDGLDRMIVFSVGSLRRAIAESVDHDHEERPHQELGNFIPEHTVMPRPTPLDEIERTERLGGLLTHDRRAA